MAHTFTTQHVGLYAWQAIKIPSPSIFVEVVMRVQLLLLLHTVATNSREVSHSMNAMCHITVAGYSC